MSLAETLILASGSPRRRELLQLIGLRHQVIPAGIEEEQNPGEAAPHFAERVARDKALAVAGRGFPSPVLAADTVVEIDDEILGKPRSAADAERMLSLLSGRTHQVHTALALVVGGTRSSLVDSASVSFQELAPEMIRWYIATGEPMDKAGAYAIQGIGGLFVTSVHGSPHTVIGLPLHRLAELWSRCGLELWRGLVLGKGPNRGSGYSASR